MRTIRKKSEEKLDRKTIKEVLLQLDAEKPITKKKACEILNIAYNTARLNKIIEDFKEKEEFRNRRKKELRNKPLSSQEKSYIISSYLEGLSLSEISENSFRSIKTIKDILIEYSIPLKETTKNYEEIFLPDNSIQENYDTGDLVFSAKYNCIAKISKKVDNTVYRIWLYGIYMQYAYQPYYELGSLTKVQKELNIDIQDMDSVEIQTLIAEGLINAKKSLREKNDG